MDKSTEELGLFLSLAFWNRSRAPGLWVAALGDFAVSGEVMDASGNSRATLECGSLLLPEHSVKDVHVSDVGQETH